MNCLLLLIILFCCNGNGCSGNSNCMRGNSCISNCNSRGGCKDARMERSCNSSGGYNARKCNSSDNCNTNVRNYEAGNEGFDSRTVRVDCDCDVSSTLITHQTQPTVSRTQFPYLEVEPRTCGCEEKSDS